MKVKSKDTRMLSLCYFWTYFTTCSNVYFVNFEQESNQFIKALSVIDHTRTCLLEIYLFITPWALIIYVSLKLRNNYRYFVRESSFLCFSFLFFPEAALFSPDSINQVIWKIEYFYRIPNNFADAHFISFSK